MEKKYCNHRLGVGWNQIGLMTYDCLKIVIEKRRSTQTSKSMEFNMRQSYAGIDVDHMHNNKKEHNDEMQKMAEFLAKHGMDATGCISKQNMQICIHQI